jgi:hypothetical protein
VINILNTGNILNNSRFRIFLNKLYIGIVSQDQKSKDKLAVHERKCKPRMSKSRFQFAQYINFNYLNNSQFSCF